MYARPILKSLQFGDVIGREKTLAEHIPYLRHVDDETLRLKEGQLIVCVKLDGFCFQTADQSEINLRLTARNTLVRALNDSRFALYSHIIRRECPATIGGDFDNPFCAALDRGHMASLRQRRMYVNDLYLTIIRRSFQGKVGKIDGFMNGLRSMMGHAPEDRDREARSDLKEAVANVVAALAPYGARILKIVSRPLPGQIVEGREPGDPQYGLYSEPCEFLAQLLNGGVEIPMALPRMGLDSYLPTRRVTFGRKAFEMVGPNALDLRFGTMLSVREYPAWTGPGMLDGLLRIKGEFIVSQSFSIADKAPTLTDISRVERQIAASDEAGTEVEEAISIARNEMVAGRTVMGTHHLTVAALGRTIKGMERCVQDVTAELQNLGMTVVREATNAQPAFFAQLPGNFGYIARGALISSRNFCGFASLHNFAVGKKNGNHWGPAISLLQTTSSTPYYFNFHRRQVGNFTVCGPTGSGKTVGLSFLMAQAQRIGPRPRCVFFDKDLGANVFVRAMGGQYERLRPGEATGFNPLQLPDTPGDRDFVFNLLKFMVRPRDGSMLRAEQEKILEFAVEQVFKEPIATRKFSEIGILLQGRERAHQDDLATRFEVWTRARGWLFNNPIDHWSAGNGIIGFDLTDVLDDEDIRTAALGYIFHRIESMMDGRPMMMFIDEGWKILNDDTFSAFLNDKLKTIRKLNGCVGFGTQSAKDIASATMAHTLIEQTPTNLFFPNPKADDKSYLEAFKLTHAELAWVRETAPESREFLIKHDQDSVIAKLDLSSVPWAPKVLSSTPALVEEMEALIERFGPEPKDWLPHYCGVANLFSQQQAPSAA
jgi:type IV secretion system protein VirB4